MLALAKLIKLDRNPVLLLWIWLKALLIGGSNRKNLHKILQFLLGSML